MTGSIGIVRRGHTYQVRYASDNPHEKDRQPYTCPDEAHLETWLHYYGLEPWAIHQVFTELQRGGGDGAPHSLLCEGCLTALSPSLTDDQQGAPQVKGHRSARGRGLRPVSAAPQSRRGEA